jgi:hypothetical protein
MNRLSGSSRESAEATGVFFSTQIDAAIALRHAGAPYALGDIRSGDGSGLLFGRLAGFCVRRGEHAVFKTLEWATQG